MFRKSYTVMFNYTIVVLEPPRAEFPAYADVLLALIFVNNFLLVIVTV